MIAELQQRLTKKQEVLRALLSLLQKIHPNEFTHVSEERIFSYELGLDSIAKIELAVAIHQKFGITLDDNEMMETYTLDHLAETIIQKQKQSHHNIANATVSIESQILEAPFETSVITRLIRAPAYYLLAKMLQRRFQLEVQGKEYFPQGRTFIIAANHSSHLDNPSLMLAAGFPFEDYVLLAAKDYFFDRKSASLLLLRYFFNLAPFDRNTEPSAMHHNMHWCKAAMAQRKNLIIFPEATRSMNGQIQPFKGGCALMAYELMLPIVPAYIKGAYECLPKGKSWPQKGKISVHFGQPLWMEHYLENTTATKSQVYRKITQDLELQIKQLEIATK
jgi:long-chain acyl-CoA synthetase